MTEDLTTHDVTAGSSASDRRRPGRTEVDPQLVTLLRDPANESPLLYAEEWQIMPVSSAQLRRERILLRALQGMAVAWALSLAASIIWMSPALHTGLMDMPAQGGPGWSHP